MLKRVGIYHCVFLTWWSQLLSQLLVPTSAMCTDHDWKLHNKRFLWLNHQTLLKQLTFCTHESFVLVALRSRRWNQVHWIPKSWWTQGGTAVPQQVMHFQCFIHGHHLGHHRKDLGMALNGAQKGDMQEKTNKHGWLYWTWHAYQVVSHEVTR